MDLYTNLSSSMEELSAAFNSRMAQYEEDLKSVNAAEATHKTVASLSKDFTDFKCLIWKTMSALKTQMELLVTGLDRHEMASRRKVLLLHGLTEDKDADLQSHVVRVLTTQVNMTNFSSADIIACHRLGNNKSKARPVLIRFHSLVLRSEVWRKKSSLKGSGLTLTEFLTKPRHDVFMDARKYYGMPHCWTSEGKIVIQLPVPDKSRRKIETAAELRQLKLQFPVSESPCADNIVKVTKNVSPAPAPEKRMRKPVK